MPKYQVGDIWSQYGKSNSVILVTTNNVVTEKGELVMGAGAALQAKWKEPDLPKRLGKAIQNPMYGVVGDEEWNIWGFQTKTHYKAKSDLQLIKHSIEVLKWIVKDYPDATFNLCWPGIGFGRLTKEDTKPMLDELPDNVTVWSFD